MKNISLRLMVQVVFLAAIFLQGCVPAAFVAAGAATGVIVYDKRSAKTIVKDRDITFQVQSKLDHDKELSDKAHVSITTFNNIALLVGQTPSARLRKKAEKIVRSHSKIRLLYNEVSIGKPLSNRAMANDAWITTKVKTVLATTSGLNSTSLKIITENKVVYLMGLTTRQQAELATKKTRTVAGVKKVVKLFEYIN